MDADPSQVMMRAFILLASKFKRSNPTLWKRGPRRLPHPVISDLNGLNHHLHYLCSARISHQRLCLSEQGAIGYLNIGPLYISGEPVAPSVA